LSRRHQDYVDGHAGEVYRLGDNSDIDRLYERRSGLYFEYIDESDEASYLRELAEASAAVEDEKQSLLFPNVERRLTTHERRARGLSDTRPA